MSEQTGMSVPPALVVHFSGGLAIAQIPASKRLSAAEIRARLNEVANKLRESSSIDPAARGPLAELVDELNRSLATENLPPEEMRHLADTTLRLAESLQNEEEG